jgi:hypothetical protein
MIGVDLRAFLQSTAFTARTSIRQRSRISNFVLTLLKTTLTSRSLPMSNAPDKKLIAERDGLVAKLAKAEKQLAALRQWKADRLAKDAASDAVRRHGGELNAALLTPHVLSAATAFGRFPRSVWRCCHQTAAHRAETSPDRSQPMETGASSQCDGASTARER